MKHSTLGAWICAALLSPALLAQAPAAAPQAKASAPAFNTARARALFSTADVDHDGNVTPREAAGMGIVEAQFRAFDDDGDLKVGSEEFMVGIRQWVRSAGGQVDPDLDAEATRLQALRKARQAEGAKKQEHHQDRREHNARADAAGSESTSGTGADSSSSGSTTGGTSQGGATSGGAGAPVRPATQPQGGDAGRTPHPQKGGDTRPKPRPQGGDVRPGAGGGRPADHGTGATPKPGTPAPKPAPKPRPAPRPKPAGGGGS